MFTDNDLRLMGGRTATAAAYDATTGAPTGYPTGQDVKAASGVSTNTIDLSVVREIGSGKPLYAVFTVTGAATRAAGAIGSTFNVVTDDDAALGSPTVLAATGSIAKADLGLGAQFVIAIPPGALSAALRYLGVTWVNSNAADSFNVVCDIVDTVADGMKFYATSVTVE